MTFTVSMSVCLLHILEHAALEASEHLFEMVHLVAYFIFLPICQASYLFVAHTAVFAPSYRNFNRCGHFLLYLLAIIFCHITSKLFTSLMLLKTAAWTLWVPILFAQTNTQSLGIVFSSPLMSSLIISANISEPFSLCMNCSFKCLSVSV